MKRIPRAMLPVLLAILILFQMVTLFGMPPSLGNALTYSGASDSHVHLGSALGTVDNFTIEAWVQRTSPGNYHIIFFNGTRGSNGYGVGITGENQIALLVGGVWTFSGSALITTEVTHIALTRENGSWRIYANGIYVLSGPTVPNTPSGDFTVGGDPDCGFSGSIDEVRFSGVVRYTDNFSPSTEPFTSDGNTLALYHFDEGIGTTTADASGNGRTLTLVGSPLPEWGPSALPVEVATFSVTAARQGVAIQWTTASEQDNYGFEIERAVPAIAEWTKVGFVAGYGTTNTLHRYIYTDRPRPGRFAYRLKQIDSDGRSHYSTLGEAVVLAPDVVMLSDNYPDPFNPATQIDYSVPDRTDVSLKIYDLAGKEIAVLVDGMRYEGTYTTTWNAQNFPSGVYFCRMTAGAVSVTRKLVLMR